MRKPGEIISRKAKVSSMIMLSVAAAFVFNGVALTVEAGFYPDRYYDYGRNKRHRYIVRSTLNGRYAP